MRGHGVPYAVLSFIAGGDPRRAAHPEGCLLAEDSFG